MKVSSSAVTNTIKRYDESVFHDDRHRKGRHRVTSAVEDTVLLHLHCLLFGVFGWVSVQHFEISADVRRAI